MMGHASTDVFEKLELDKVLGYIGKYISTENGKSILEDIVPFDNLKDAEERGKLIQEAKDILIENGNLPLTFLPDLNNCISRSAIDGTILTEENIKNILELLEISRRMYQYLNQNFKTKVLFEKYSTRLLIDKVLEHALSGLFTQQGTIADNASKKLKEIRSEIRDKQDILRKVVGQILKKLSDTYLVQEDFSTISDGRTVLPVKAEHKRHVKGFIHSESASGQTVYIEPTETLELNNELLSLSFAEKREIDRILKEVTKRIGASVHDLRITLLAISELDLIFAAAKYSTEIMGSFSNCDLSKSIKLIDAKHPVLLNKLGINNTVPLNIEFEKERVIVITGPNAGGKTVVLKTVGLITLVLLCGLHAPIHPDSNLHSINRVLVDIGDEQSIEEDLSTYSSHLTNIKHILNKTDENSLVLLDEIGTGTDPTEGSALATALLLKLIEKKSYALTSTHHGNLKVFAHESENIQNGSMQFDLEKLMPTYKFVQGIPGSSYAFEVARRIGFENSFIELAKEFVDSDKYKLEEFLAKIEEHSNKLQQRLNESEIENSRLKGLTNLYKNKIEELESQKKEIINKSKIEAQLYLKDVNKTLEDTVRKIRESNADKTVVKEQRKIIEAVKSKNNEELKLEQKTFYPDVSLKVGDFVSIRDTNTTGKIISIQNEKNIAEIASGTLKLKVRMNQLIKTKEDKTEIETGYQSRFISSDLPSARIDIRGKRPEELDFELVKFLDDAFASGYDRVEIVHGKGTGVLKKTTHEILKRHENVKNYYFGKIEMGGEGITIVEFQ
ncbi:MAG: endonuclease MutS2 [Melioribacteraceae bacterium]|nr:endonuclease MutS2 [Melioribacteraceae bacterium]